jgi:Icc-related predicted phosphoesterase
VQKLADPALKIRDIHRMANKPLINKFVVGAIVLCIALSGVFGQKTPSFSDDLRDRSDKNTIIFVGDTQRTGLTERALLREQNDVPRQAIMDEIAQENPACLVILGDLVASGGDRKEWKYFEKVTANLWKNNIPVFAVPGNHDYYGSKDSGIANFFQHFPYLGKRTWNSFRFRDIAVILLNSNFNELTSSEIESQNKWYLKTLKEFQKDPAVSAIIVCCHYAPYTNSTIVSASKDVRKNFVAPFAETPKAKIFFSGHCHSYEHFEYLGKTFIVTGGGGGPRQELQVKKKKQKYHDLFNGPSVRPFHFCRLVLSQHALKVQMMCLKMQEQTWYVGDEVTQAF